MPGNPTRWRLAKQPCPARRHRVPIGQTSKRHGTEPPSLPRGCRFPCRSDSRRPRVRRGRPRNSAVYRRGDSYPWAVGETSGLRDHRRTASTVARRLRTVSTRPPTPHGVPRFPEPCHTTRRVIGHGDMGPLEHRRAKRVERPVAFIGCRRIRRACRGPYGNDPRGMAQRTAHDDDVAKIQGLGGPDPAGATTPPLPRLVRSPPSRAGRLRRAHRRVRNPQRPGRSRGAPRQASFDEALSESGYPVMWAIAWRARSASWICDTIGSFRKP